MPQLQEWGFFFPFLFFGLISQEPYSWLCTCVLHVVYICMYKRLQNSTGLFCKTEGIGKLSWRILFPLFPFFLAPSPSSLQEVTLNRELFSRLQLEFYNKISVRSPYFFTCQVVAVIIWQLPSWLTCSRLNWGSPELKVWAATLWAKAL